MALLPLALLTPLLAPLRRLAARGWLREADVDGLLRHAHPLASLNRHYARVEARYWVADDMLALALRTAPAGRRRGRASTSSCWRSATGCGSGAATA
ncbi:putative ferredoxin [Pseudomonas aeruginosa]|nr:putative ferredoxin [Pseudomonas aeruginosa]RCH07594.1 putative ferredoxin [Pseudomonas aeruginosa]